MEMQSIFSGVALIVADIVLLITAIGAILALLAGHARFIEVDGFRSPHLYLFWRGLVSGDGSEQWHPQSFA